MSDNNIESNREVEKSKRSNAPPTAEKKDQPELLDPAQRAKDQQEARKRMREEAMDGVVIKKKADQSGSSLSPDNQAAKALVEKKVGIEPEKPVYKFKNPDLSPVQKQVSHKLLNLKRPDANAKKSVPKEIPRKEEVESQLNKQE